MIGNESLKSTATLDQKSQHLLQSRTASPREAGTLSTRLLRFNGSELQIGSRLMSADTHASLGGLVSQHQLAKRDTLSR